MAGDIVNNSIFFIVVPWVAWVTISIFSQRQEIALLKQILFELKRWKNEA